MADPETQRLVGEYLAGAVKKRTQRSLALFPTGVLGRSPGRELLLRVANPWIRFLVLVGLGAVPLAMLLFGEPGGRARAVGFPLFLLFMIFFGPRRRGWLTWWR